jgi:hypothetical protein
VALGEEIGVSEPDKIHRSNICLKPKTPKTNQKIAPKRAQPSEKKFFGGEVKLTPRPGN